MASVSPYSQALPGACRGYFYARNADQSVTVFAATASKIYKLNNTDFSWTDVSKAGGSYTAAGNGEQWQFAQFNNFVIAAQINTVLQVFDLTSSSAFADLGGSPPPARYVAVVNRFVVLSGTVSTKDVIEKAVNLASGFVDKKEEVVSLLQVDSSTRTDQVLLKVRFAEVSRAALTDAGVSFFTSPTGIQNTLGRVTSYEELTELANGAGLGDDLVVQTPYGDSGKTTFFIRGERDWDRCAGDILINAIRPA